MANSLYPAFITIEYSSSYGQHIMTIPTRTYTPDSDPEVPGTIPRWSDDVPVAVNTLVDALVHTMEAQFPDTVNFNRFTVFTLATPTSDPIPRFSQALDIAGTGVSVGWSKAVQLTITAQAVDFSLGKLVLLDSGSFNTFDKVVAPGESATIDAIFAEWSSTSKCWATRGGTRPNVFKQASKTLNERLRREYRMN